MFPKQVNENTPIRYKEWLEAIKDTLDGKVEESNYHDVMIQKIFNSIEEDGITPTERYAMFEEYDQREIAETRLKNKLKFIANNMVAEGLSLEIISKVTGLTVSEIENSSDEYFDKELYVEHMLFVPDICTTEYVNGAGQCIDSILFSVENVGQR